MNNNRGSSIQGYDASQRNSIVPAQAARGRGYAVGNENFNPNVKTALHEQSNPNRYRQMPSPSRITTANMTDTSEFTNSMNKLSNLDENQIALNSVPMKDALDDHQRNVAAMGRQSPTRGGIQPRPGGLRAAHH